MLVRWEINIDKWFLYVVVIRRVYRGVYDVRVVSSDGVGDVSDVDCVEVFVVVGSFNKNLKCNIKTLLIELWSKYW